MERTSQTGLRACVDWVGTTFKNVELEHLILDILKMNPSEFLPGDGKYGYKQSLRCGSIAIYFDGREDMGMHLELKGRGCREYERLGIQTWKELFQSVFMHQGYFTRLDPAVDDFEGMFTIRKLVNKIKKAELISPFKLARVMETIKIHTGDVNGITLYFGSPQSDIQIRMYDKLAERKGTNYNVSEDIEVWNRTELQLRDEKAMQVAGILATKEDGEEFIGETVCGILKHYLRFVEKGKSKDTNKRRWKTAKFWDKFLGEVEKLPLTVLAEEKTVLEKKEWLRKSIAPTMALVFKAFDNDMDQIADIIEEGCHRLKEKDYEMIRRHKKSSHCPPNNVSQ
ncbi:replication initiation factor domain-containing protein [Bacillus wiedmannii]|uniref:replication initiation factor domain-containing protein n=1 Tax=Bacillus wiedmannii TaxID=1890302 RepID=UPI00159BEAA0|nr:replication initiation factor domain-containing protein [Bacillus wiedmannii]